jgi:hypothetical protein
MESMGEPAAPGIPVVLQDEFTRALADHPALTPEALLAAARQAGLDAQSPKPLCIAHRRAPDGRERQQLFFAIFDLPHSDSFGSIWRRNGTAASRRKPSILRCCRRR